MIAQIYKQPNIKKEHLMYKMQSLLQKTKSPN